MQHGGDPALLLGRFLPKLGGASSAAIFFAPQAFVGHPRGVDAPISGIRDLRSTRAHANVFRS